VVKIEKLIKDNSQRKLMAKGINTFLEGIGIYTDRLFEGPTVRWEGSIVESIMKLFKPATDFLSRGNLEERVSLPDGRQFDYGNLPKPYVDYSNLPPALFD